MSFHDRKTFIVSMWHRNIARLTLETITNFRFMNFSTDTSRTIIFDFLFLAFSEFIYSFLFFWLIFTHHFYENFYKRDVFLILEIICNKIYFYVKSFVSILFFVSSFFWCFNGNGESLD